MYREIFLSYLILKSQSLPRLHSCCAQCILVYETWRDLRLATDGSVYYWLAVAKNKPG